jgi:hypothetical protein
MKKFSHLQGNDIPQLGMLMMLTPLYGIIFPRPVMRHFMAKTIMD